MQMKFRNHFRAVPFILFLIGGFSFFAWYVNFDPLAILIFSIFLILTLAPTIFLHVEYFLVSKDQSIQIGEDEIIVQNGNGTTTSYKNIELHKIIIYQSANIEKGGIPLSPTEFYFYVKIIAKNERSPIFITSLILSESLKELDVLKKVPRETKRSFFASIRYPIIIPQPLF